MTGIFKRIDGTRDIFTVFSLSAALLLTVPFLWDIFYILRDVFIIWGLLLIAADIAAGQRFLKNCGRYPLIAFCIFYAVTLIVNWDINPRGNIQTALYTAVNIFVLYGYTKEHSFKKTAYLCTVIFLTAAGLISFFNCMIFFSGFDVNYETINIPNVFLGSYGGRLYGIAGNPNNNGMLNIISLAVIILIFFLYKNKKKRQNIILSVLLVLNITSAALSDSRGANLSFAVFAAFGAFLFVFFKKADLKKIKKILLSAAAAVTAGALSIVAFPAVDTACNTVLMTVNYPVYERYMSQEDYREGMEEMTNGRSKLWAGAVKVIARYPVFGVSYKGIPEKTALAAGEDLPGINGGGYHNIIFEVLGANGFAGGLSMLAAALCMLAALIKSKAYKTNDPLFTGAFLMLVLILANNMTENRIIYGLGYNQVIFGLCLSIVMSKTNNFPERRSRSFRQPKLQ